MREREKNRENTEHTIESVVSTLENIIIYIQTREIERELTSIYEKWQVVAVSKAYICSAPKSICDETHHEELRVFKEHAQR